MNWFLIFTTSVLTVVAILSVFEARYILQFTDKLRKRGHFVAYITLMTGWLLVMMYGIAWLLYMLHLAGLPVESVVTFLFDLFVINLNG